MRIGIDARFYGSVGKGLGRYTKQLIHALEGLDTVNEYFIFLRKENIDECVLRGRNFHKVLADIPWYGWKEQWRLPLLFRRYRIDLAHFPHFNIPFFYRGRFVVTIHDLILLHHPTVRATRLNPLLYRFKFMMYRLVLRRAIMSSDWVLTVSRFTKRDILRHYPVDKRKIIVTREASTPFCPRREVPPEEKQRNDELVLRRYGIMNPYVLYVGNAYPHKNLERLVRMFRMLSDAEIRLVLVGKMDYFYSRLRKLIRREGIERIIFTDFVPDEDLGVLYANADLYVFPSLYEGFGLPPLEAMARGVPVASSNRTSMPEILGDAAVYFDPEDEEDMYRVIRGILGNRKLRIRLGRAGLSRSSRYDWNRMAQTTLRVYGRSPKR